MQRSRQLLRKVQSSLAKASRIGIGGEAPVTASVSCSVAKVSLDLIPGPSERS
jgi:hypothetical protein